ncbi:HlyD family efflux transporter periplasmic adaptor subunit [Lacunimicrobium album]
MPLYVNDPWVINSFLEFAPMTPTRIAPIETKPARAPVTPSKPASNPDLPIEIVNHTPLSQAERTGQQTSLLFPLLLVIATIAITIAVVKREEILTFINPPPQPTLIDPEIVYALGRLEPQGEVRSVSAPSGSGDMRIEDLKVDVNDTVKKGDILAILDSHPRLAAAVDIAKQTLSQAKSQLSQTQLEVETTRKQLEATLRAAEHRYDMSHSNLVRAETLRNQKAVSDEVYEARRNDSQAAEEAIAEAAARLQRYQAASDTELVDITVARQQIDIAEANLKQAQANLETSYITAPIDGVILDVHLYPGERVGSSPLLDMGATQRMMVRVEVYESDVPRLHLGQEAHIIATPLAEALTGKIDRISNFVQRQQIVDAAPAAFTDSRVVEVWVRLDEKSSPRAAQLVNLQVNVQFQPQDKAP